VNRALEAPVLGYRAWYVTLDCPDLPEPWLRPVLHSAYSYGYVWQPGINVAECRRAEQERRNGGPGHEPPATDCYCGLHAYTSPWRAWWEALHIVAAASLLPNCGSPLLLFGAVVLWGKVEAHRDGVRGEFAEVVALAPLLRKREDRLRRLVLDALAAEFDVPVLLPARKEVTTLPRALRDEIRVRRELARAADGWEARTVPRQLRGPERLRVRSSARRLAVLWGITLALETAGFYVTNETVAVVCLCLAMGWCLGAFKATFRTVWP
jgi:hypothetical protein